MRHYQEHRSALVVEYNDPEEGFRGWLVFDSLEHQLCAGGMRVQQGLTRELLVGMARNMTCKMRLCGLRVNGAKCGIDYDPASPGKHAAMTRFMTAIRSYIQHCYSMGPDLNVEMIELEEIGREIGLASVKMAVAEAQGWDLDYFMERCQALTEMIDGRPLGTIRAGYGVAMAALGMLDYLGVPPDKATVMIQGFGTLARAAAFGLLRKGVRITGLADVEKSYIATHDAGLDVEQLLDSDGHLLPPVTGGRVRTADREEIFRVPCDIVIPAAVENAIDEEVAAGLEVRAVVPGANLAVTPPADHLLHERKIPVVPDFLAGCGGSLSMEGLFGPPEHPTARQVLDHVETRMVDLVRRTMARSSAERVPPTRAALAACAETVVPPAARAYEIRRKQ